MKSYWEKEFWFDTYDYVIIGAGIVGLSTALELKIKHPRSSVLILEREEIPHGASTKNAGFACFGTVSEILDDLNTMREQEVIDLIALRWNGLRRLQSRVPKKDMTLLNNGGYEVFDAENTFEKYSGNLGYVNEIIESAVGEEKVLQVKEHKLFPNLYAKMIYNRFESQLNPVQLIRYLVNACQSKGIRLAFSNEVVGFDDNPNKGVTILLRNQISISSAKLLICNNAFIHSVIKDLDVIPARNQVIISHPIEALKIKGTFHYDKGYVYFRNVGNRILIGGARNLDLETEATDKFGPNIKILDSLTAFVRHNLGMRKFKCEHTWSGIIATGSSKSSIVMQHSDNVFVAVRQGGMGVAIGSEIAYQIAELAG